MINKKILKPDYLFEVSWEVCNKVGGIYTVVATKAPGIQLELGNNYILIGPDVWKETSPNPEFTEDKSILRVWRERAESEGLRIKIGRWNIKGRPVAILVDFTQYIPSKDKILAEFWEKYKLDSISGSWDYFEPALFGYAAGRVIESFYEYSITAQDKIIAQFHEWMTGGGILYLNDRVPQIGTIFTTHATVVGRSIAGNNLPLYSHFEDYHGDAMANRFHVMAKHSLEHIAAIESDAFTTVSKLTANECRQFLGREPDIITPNGFDDSLFLDKDTLAAKRQKAREKLLAVAQAVTGQSLPADSLLLVNSGRYEFRNKGIDLFIDALASLNRNEKLEYPVVAFITIPAHHSGPVQGLLEKVESGIIDDAIEEHYLTHGLFEPDYDPILKRLKENSLFNSLSDQVKVIFVPSYLNGNDGVFNLSYYDLLPGFDLSVFPSYYEPWGYTPLESLVFGVPTVTTTLAGFGLWVKDLDNKSGIAVIVRNDDNNETVVDSIHSIVLSFAKMSKIKRAELSTSAISLAHSALWSNLLTYYKQAYSIALEKVLDRSDLFRDKRQAETVVSVNGKKPSHPEWRKVLVSLTFPESMNGLLRLSRNIYWCWNTEATDLFRLIDPERWENSEHNPISMLESLTYNQLQALEKNPDFMTRLKAVMTHFDAYMATSVERTGPKIAYFSMEFGLHESVKIYSGGLGILAGDYLKEASDSNVNIIAVGLLYRYGYFNQTLSPFGEQVPQYFPQRFNHLPIKPVRDADGEWVMVSVSLPGRILYAKVWMLEVGRIPLYLLDADIEENSEEDRFVTHQLYGGDLEVRFKQELLLGVGGIRVLEALDIEADLYHCNEGHAAFIGIERLRKYVQNNQLSFLQAIELVRASTLFTTHTPVPAGHDAFTEDLLRTYIPHYAVRLNISWNTFMNLGRYVENNNDQKFSMSVLAAKLSQEMNGVSRIHGKVSRQMFKDMYNGFYENEIHIGYVTNGVHFPTWTNAKWKKLYIQEFGEEYIHDQSNPEYWKKIHNVPDERIWQIRQDLRGELISYIKKRLIDSMSTSSEKPTQLIQIVDSLDNKALTIGFARRFATYKRAHLLFSNIERLAQIMSNQEFPIQFVFAGKAHPADKAGADLIKRIVEVSRMPQFVSKIIFLENYNMAMARKLVQGVDIWLNTPARPMEASGTSGEKAVMNGVVNFSVLDGWWAEGYREDAGWALKEERTYENQQFQDELDAETIYNILEDEIIPAFYERDNDGVPHAWVKYIKNTISGIAPHFTMKRQLDDYYEKYYLKLAQRSALLKEDDNAALRSLASWKFRMIRNWEGIEVVDIIFPNPSTQVINLGDIFVAELILNLGDIAPDDIMAEMISGQKTNDNMIEPQAIREMQLAKVDGNAAHFTIEIETSLAGVFDFAFRLTPKNPLLPHRMDFNLVKWV
ncbi:MAG: alpha-glucan family phosphorylase [Lentimicrobiaceae bacterium]|jgi:phosphorylase/glycogen(starch) synthase